MPTRRAFLSGTGAALGAVAGARRARGPRPLTVEGTTLEHTIVTAPDAGRGSYRHLTLGPPRAVVTRSELAPAAVAGEELTALAHIIQLTDVHITDAQSPCRVEFLDVIGNPFTGSHRPQELLTTHVHHSMVRRVNDVGRSGPWTGRPLDCVVSTGDNVDNQQRNELGWFLTGMNGGRLVPGSGGPDYEGVQLSDWPDPSYWRPEGPAVDPFRSRGFPELPGYLEAAVTPFDSTGLEAPWYATYGNHDGLVQGTIPSSQGLAGIAVGRRKLVGPPPGAAGIAFAAQMMTAPDEVIAAIDSGDAPTVEVTPDPARAPVTPSQWVEAHLERPGLYFRFDVSELVVGISLDTGGFNSGSVGEDQFRWLESQLRGLHSHELGDDGRARPTGGDDRLVVLFSHFPLDDLDGSLPDPSRPQERRVLQDEIRTMLHRWPNVVAWVNGHRHHNSITPRADPSGRSAGFWEITTASHVDFPQQARSIEIAMNADGSLSLFTTVIEHAAPHLPHLGDLSPLNLASLSRELAANSMSVDELTRLDVAAENLNTRLLLPAPFPLSHVPAATPTPTRRSRGGLSPLVPAAIGAAGVTAAAVLHRRLNGTQQPRALDTAPKEGSTDPVAQERIE